MSHLCSLTAWCNFPKAISAYFIKFCCDGNTFPIYVLSAHLGVFKPIDSRTPDTAGCHVWRACAWRLTAQGYLKGCANFALFTAPINPICSDGPLCLVCVLHVGQSMVNICCRVVLLLCLVGRLKGFALMCFVSFDFLPHPLTPQGQPCHSSPPWRLGRGKCRRPQSAGRFRPRKVAVSFPSRFLVASFLCFCFRRASFSSRSSHIHKGKDLITTHFISRSYELYCQPWLKLPDVLHTATFTL